MDISVYQISYHLDGYTPLPEDCQYTYGTGLTLPVPIKDGFHFDGWYEKADCSGSRVSSIGSAETGDKEYYGRWTFRITVMVRKDGVEWAWHGRVFMLLAENGALTDDFDKVSAGDYFVYDVTGAAGDSLLAAGVDTDIRVSVKDKDVDVTVDYYTVTFLDGSTAYGADTPQAPQVILKGKKAARPADPSREGYQFRQWATADNGSTAFNFNAPITQKSDVYASWISETADRHTIKSSAGEGGSISPEGEVLVEDGGKQVFEITPDDGWRIKAVMVDDDDRTGELTGSAAARAARAQARAGGYYTFSDVKEDHTIKAVFEEAVPYYSVTVSARKDGGEWTGHGRKFMLLAEDGTLTEDFGKVRAGDYLVYDATGAASDGFMASGVNTGIAVSVADKDVDVAVDYYTVTFHDGAVAYEAGTPQAPQVVLKGEKAARPADPSRDGYKFQQWVTEDNGDEAFDFDVPVTQKTSVYAGWISEKASGHTIRSSAGEGGSIFPEGEVRVENGGGQVFVITPDDGWRIKAVVVDYEDRTEELADSVASRAVRVRAEASRYYIFSDVKEDHTVRVVFEEENGGNSGDGETDVTDDGGGNSDDGTVNATDDGDSGNSRSGGSETPSGERDPEPKTGDNIQVGLYATLAMVAGFGYLLLYFADHGHGMAEETEAELISRLDKWAGKGGKTRRKLAFAAASLLRRIRSIGRKGSGLGN